MARTGGKKKYTGGWWNSQLSAAEDRHSKFFEDARESIQLERICQTPNVD